MTGREVFANLVKLLTGKAAAGLISLVYIAIVARALGPAQFGVLVTVNAWAVTVGGIVAFSGWHGIVRYGAQARAAGDAPRLVRLARFMTLVELGCGLLAIAGAALFAPLAARQLGWPPALVPLSQVYALAIGANLLTTPHGLLQLAGRFDLLGLHPALAPLVRLAGTLWVWGHGGGLADYLVVWLVSAVSEGVFKWLLAIPAWRALRAGEPLLGPALPALRENVGLLRFLAVTNIDLTLRDLAPKAVPLIVGATLGPAAAGLYSVAQRAAVIVQQPAVQLAQASFPAVAAAYARGDSAAGLRLARRTAGWALGVAVAVVALLALFARPLVTLLAGPAFANAAGIFVLLACGRAALLGAVPLSSALLAAGRTSASVAINIVINLGSLPLLALVLPLFGLAAAGWHGLLTGVATLVALALVLRAGKRCPASLDRTLTHEDN